MSEGVGKFGLLVALSLVISTSASAQARGGFAARGTGGLARMPSGPSRGLAAPGRTILGSRPGVFRPGVFTHPIVGTPLNPNFAPIRGVPGLGFDRRHLAAIEHPFLNRFGRGRGLFPFIRISLRFFSIPCRLITTRIMAAMNIPTDTIMEILLPALPCPITTPKGRSSRNS